MLAINSSRFKRIRFEKVMVLLCLIVSCCCVYSCGSNKVVHNTIYNDEPAVVALKEKYSSILHVDYEDVRNISLYKNIDKWVTVKDSNMLKLGSLNVSFIQFLYYLNLNTKLPVGIDEIYGAHKTYLFKDCHFLEEGDLVFFKEKYRSVKEVGFYLDNDIFVAADAGGELCFHHLRDSITKFQVISNAKIIRDAE